MFEEGKAYMVCQTNGWVLFGRAVKPVGIFAWEFESAGYIVSTGGTPWGELAAGKGRDNANFRPLFGKVNIGTLVVWSQDWKGKLPNEK